jgi:UDP-N-acetylmuramoyl-L-alanyl-D-glutamate--2,6-diaminopimelate ligase
MKLSDLLKGLCHTSFADLDVTGLQNDSRAVVPGDVFFAYAGALVDGRIFCQQARQAGAVAVVYDPEQLPQDFQVESHIPYVPLTHLANHLPALASRFYNHPTHDLFVTAVTGTNGKTTIAYQLAQAHSLLGRQSAYIGTLGQGQVHAILPTRNTTPDALCLQRLFHEYKQQGIQEIAMEVSSHALAQNRVGDIQFQHAIYTNLSHDHLDYHKTMTAYADAKARLFKSTGLQCAIINADDAYAAVMTQSVPNTCNILTYGLNQADVRAFNIQTDMSGSRFDVDSPWGVYHLEVKAIGAFNIYNSLAIFASLMVHGYQASDVQAVMAELQPSPGRMAWVSQAPYVVVDYAHTPDALENVLNTLIPLKKGRLIVVFGCGGDRDKTKRPIMGRIASEHADVVIITSDNPRHESPDTILDDILTGVLAHTTCVRIVEREEAIRYALSIAESQDIIVIAGKGHESYQQIGDKRLDFSDEAVVRQFLIKTVLS